MKKQLVWFVLLLGFVLAGCGDDGHDEVLYVTNDDLLIKNNIMDVIKVFNKDKLEDNTSMIYYGVRKGKDWFALFDVKSGSLLEEWYGKERAYVRPEGPVFSDPNAFYRLFSKLKSGGYAYVYWFIPDDIKQLVRLCDNQKVEYGFELENDIQLFLSLTEDRFLGRKADSELLCIYDFAEKIHVEDVLKNNDSNYPWYIGFQEDRPWIGYHDKEGDFHEPVCTGKFERNRKVHIGYGEYKEFYIWAMGIRKLIETDWGYAFLPIYGIGNASEDRYDVFLMNKDKLIFVPLVHGGYSDLRNWYDGSIFVNKYILSPEGKVIAEFSSFNGGNIEPVSYEEGVSFYYGHFERHNYVTNETIWRVKVDKLNSVASDARVAMALLEKKGELWSYQCDVVNKDGSKSQFKLSLHIGTGTVTYL